MDVISTLAFMTKILPVLENLENICRNFYKFVCQKEGHISTLTMKRLMAYIRSWQWNIIFSCSCICVCLVLQFYIVYMCNLSLIWQQLSHVNMEIFELCSMSTSFNIWMYMKMSRLAFTTLIWVKKNKLTYVCI